MLAQDVRFHPDEALYVTYARRVALHGDLLLSDAPLDKPPLTIAAIALSFSSFGPGEFAARLPSFFASLLTLATLHALTHRLYKTASGANITILLLALSPLDLAFAATAFLDPLLTLWLIIALLAASHDRWRIGGIAFALALATKQSALFFAPLIVAIGVGRVARSGWTWRDLWHRLCRFAIVVIIGALLLALWSAARAAPIDFWTLGALNNDPGRLIRANELLPRLVRWLDLLTNVTGFGPLLLLMYIPLLQAIFRPRPSRRTLIDLILLSSVLAYFFAYWLIALNTYDRYLHPLGSLVLLLIGRAIIKTSFTFSPPLHSLERGLGGEVNKPLFLLTLILILPYTLTALRGELTIGGDRGQHIGIDRLAVTLNMLPKGSIVYDYWLGWELGYYLGDQPAVQVVFQPSPQGLMRSVCGSTTESYFVGPSSEIEAWLWPLLDRGGSAALMFEDRFRLYRLSCEPPRT
jgi:4-amino-4-deoxy-L-arabinose transferase-like glycosyltransferase